MVRFQHVRGLMLAGAALAAAQAAPLWAQDQTVTSPDQGSGESIKTIKGNNGEIIVTAKHYVPSEITANKSDIPLIQTPQSESVITRDQIDLLSFVDLQQAVRYTAGVGGENYGFDPRYDFITVRGFTPRQYVDGLAVPNTTTFDSTGLDLYLFQSVDILKGPASVLYGSAPPGGILNETLRRPSSSFGGEVEVKGGTHDFKEFAGTVTGAATPFLDLRMTALYRDTSLDVDHTDDKRVAIAPSATFKIGPDTKLTALAYYQYDNNRGGSGGFVPEAGSLLPNPNGPISRSTNLDDPNYLFERRQYGAGWEFDQRFSSALRFVSNTKWSHYHENTPIGEYDSGGFVNTTDPSLPNYYRTVTQSNYTFGEKVSSFATDNRLAADVATGAIRHKAILGVDYRNVFNDANYGFDFGNRTLDVYNPVYAPVAEFPESTRYNEQRVKQTGVYGQDQVNYDKFYLTLSGRYDWVRAKTAAPYTPAASAPVYSFQKNHKFTYRVGLSYVSDNGVAPYISYATSFEPVIGTNAITGDPLKPTSVKQIEGGVKFDARGLPDYIKLFATVAGFDIKQRNFVSTQVTPTINVATQGGEVEVYGGEFELVARLYDQLSINIAYSYNHSKVLSAPAEPLDVGYPLPVAPKNKATAFADYTFKNGFIAGFGFGAGVRYTSATTGAVPGPFATPVIYGNSSTLFDAMLHYDMPGWRFSVNASNLFDKRFVARCASTVQCFFGAERQVLGTITKRF
ncbi:MAG: TonB-dependent siderophore receptor [Sphingomonadaceae bacterium]|nr:TonB-dependent siderophore receptor [Sphingomonadaceae bacterium]